MEISAPARLAMHFLLGISLLLPAANASPASAYSVSYVYDGDTVKLIGREGIFKLRLTEIDAPERNQEYGQKARRALITLCKGSNIKVNVELAGMDKYDRQLGRLQCNGTDASLYMAEHGYAWHNAKYSDSTSIRNAAAMARKNRIGLWSADKPIPPWVWRHLHQDAYQPANRSH